VLAEYDPNADALILGLYNRKAISEPTVVVAREIAAGYSKQQIAEYMNTSVSEVNRSVRELRRGFSAAALQHKVQASVPVYALQHSSVLTALTTALTRREYQVMALSVLGLKPIAIAPLLGISHGSARTTLSHARTKLAKEFAAPGVVVADVDASVRKAMSDVELLGLLPASPWRTDALSLAKDHSEMVRQSGKFNTNPRVRVVYLSSVAPYLNRMAIVLIEVRNALEDSLAITSQVGTIRRAELIAAPVARDWVGFDDLGRWVLPTSQQYMSDLPGTSLYRCPPPSWSPKAASQPSVDPFLKARSRHLFQAPKSDPLFQHPQVLSRWWVEHITKGNREDLYLFAGLPDGLAR